MAQVWFVTGSSRGLGRAIVEAGLAAGNKVLATARDIESLHDLVWSKKSNGLRWRSLRFCTGSLFEWTSPTQKQRLQSRFHDGMDYRGIQDALGALARLCHGNSEPRTLVAKRIFGGGETHPEKSDQGSAPAFGRRKDDTGRDRSPPGSKGTGGRGGNGQTRYDSGLVSEAHREQI